MLLNNIKNGKNNYIYWVSSKLFESVIYLFLNITKDWKV